MRRIAFALPVFDFDEGANVILQEIIAMRRFGVDAWIINRAANRQGFEKSYPGLDIPVIYGEGDLSGESERLLVAHGVSIDAIIASSVESFFWLPDIPRAAKLGYYIQEVETRFFTDHKAMFGGAALSYTSRPEIVRVTKSAWIHDEIRALGGRKPTVVGASVDTNLFHPRRDDCLNATSPPHVVAMVRPEARRKSADRTLRILRRLKDTFKDAVTITCFGGSARDIAAFGIPLEGICAREKLISSEVAELLGRSDVFLDFSDWQATGLTSLEAMVSGAAVVVPRNGGAAEFCHHGESGLVVDSCDEEACFEAGHRLVADAELRFAVRRAGMETAMARMPELAAVKLLEALWSAI